MAQTCGSMKARALWRSEPTDALDKQRELAHLDRMIDVNHMFGAAEAAFRAGRLPDARKALIQIGHVAGKHPAVLHLLALVEKRAGNTDASERAFIAALKEAPCDAQIHNNYANLLGDLRRDQVALGHYDLALAANPDFPDARLNRALAQHRLGQLPEALDALDNVVMMQPGNARAHSARGAVLRSLGRLGEAAAAYDQALALAPARPKAIEGRARVAMERGEPGASAHFRRALEVEPRRRELLLGLADALEAEGEAEGEAGLAGAVATDPGWVEGHERLAEMRAEAGEGDGFARSYAEAIARDPESRGLHYSYWRALALGGLFRRALDEMDAARLSPDREMLLMEAVYRSEAGDLSAAEALFAQLGDDPDTVLAQARTLLRSGDPVRSAELFESVVAAHPRDVSAWAFLDLAWRLTDDPRHEWLSGQPDLYGVLDIDLDEDRIADLAVVLRNLHRTRAHPIGQSLRGGTQTRGRLFWRGEREIAFLKGAIDRAITRFVDRLPPADPTHPLLRHRDERLEVEGSWSVRLAQSGFHINHIHPQGVLSSACYIALPESLGSGEAQDGWLQLGAPPVELGLPLGALATIEPRAGRLALFPSYLYHGTLPFVSGERLTVAFDVAAR